MEFLRNEEEMPDGAAIIERVRVMRHDEVDDFKRKLKVAGWLCICRLLYSDKTNLYLSLGRIFKPPGWIKGHRCSEEEERRMNT